MPVPAPTAGSDACALRRDADAALRRGPGPGSAGLSVGRALWAQQASLGLIPGEGVQGVPPSPAALASPLPRPRWPGCHPVGPGCLPSALPWSGSTCRSPFVTSRPCARPLNRLLGGGSSPAHAGLALECRPDPGTSLPPGRRASLGAGLPRSLLLPLGRVSAAALRGLAQRPGGPAPRTAGPGHGSAS